MVGPRSRSARRHRIELVDEHARPVIEHVSDRHAVRNAEREVQVGEAVAARHRQRPHGGTGDDALILLREPQYVLAESVPLLDGEHEAHGTHCDSAQCLADLCTLCFYA